MIISKHKNGIHHNVQMVAFAVQSVLVLSAVFLGSWAMGIRETTNNGQTFTNCGGVFEQSKGVIQTPNFPDPYPTPIYCDWLIRASPGKKIIIYFTQYYMKDSFYVTSYDYYQDRTTHLGQRDLGRLSWEHDLVSLVAYQPFVLIQFSVESIGNRHLRVMDFLLEVYGFNITYEIVDKNADVTKPTCSVKECSYLGNCLAAPDFSKYECQCFPEFFGKKCQYGPYCHPDKKINQCTNGGKCKYFFGSLINQCECPPGFAGAYCEISVTGHGAEFKEECKALNCSELCDIDETGQAFCSCLEGYKMHENNETCIPIARYRMDVTLEFATFIDISDSQLQEITKLLNASIKLNGISTLVKYGIKGLRNTSRTTVLDFHFYCMVSEVNHVYKTLKTIIDNGQLGGLPLLKARPKYEESPELLLSEVANHDPNPTLRGNLLTLVCAARGSKNIVFRWLKDNYEVNTNLTLRNAWEAIIPHTVHGMQLSVLNIDKVSPLDAGEFTCMVSDYGETQLGNVEVKVNNYPRVQLYPMSLSVSRGQTISITCLSPDDSWLKFLYEWFRNGVKIETDSKTAYVEGMFPTGVRLVVSSVLVHTEYTCKVTNEAGSANVTAHVHVYHENETELFCPKNYEGQVMWQNTSGGHFDIKPCPTDQGVVSQYGPMDIGHAKRYCVCDHVKKECTWLKPNFAKCQSLALVEIYDEMELLRFGYQKTTLRVIFNKLHQIICPARPVLLYSGDIDMVAHILKDLIVHMRHFPQLVLKQERIPVDELVETMSGMLEMSSTATPDEKALLLVGPCIVQIANTLILGSFRHLEYDKIPRTSHTVVDMGVYAIPEVLEVATSTDSSITTGKYGKYRNRRTLNGESEDMMHNVLFIKFDNLSDLLRYREWSMTNRSKQNGPSYSRAPDKNLTCSTITPLFFHQTLHCDHSLECLFETILNSSHTTGFGGEMTILVYGPYLSIVSKMYSLASYDFVDIKDWRQVTVRVELVHDQRVDVSSANTTICLAWNFDQSDLFHGEWTSDRCIVVESSTTSTVCDCRLPGHFVAAVVPSNRTIASMDPCVGGNSFMLIIGYSISLLVILTALLMFIKIFSRIMSEIYTVHLITIVGLAIATAIDLICVVHIPKTEAAQQIMRLFLLYFYFVLFTVLLAEIIQVLLLSAAIKQLQLTKLKFVIGCLGVPMLLIIPTIFVSRVFDRHLSCNQMCWLSFQMRQFYAFIVPVLCIVIVYVMLLGFCLWKIRKWNEEWRYADKVKYMKWCGKVTLLFVLLLTSLLLSVDMNSSVVSAQSVAHLLFHVALRLSVLILRCFLDTDVRNSLIVSCFGLSERNRKEMMKANNSSFRAYVKPERVQNALNQEEYSVSKYYDEINRKKYSVDRTRQLSSLLGSSICSGESSSDTKSTAITGSSISSKECDIKTPNASGNNWTLGSHIGGSTDGAGFYYSNSDKSADVKPLDKVSSFIRSDYDDDDDDDDGGGGGSFKPGLENRTLNSKRNDRDGIKLAGNLRNPPPKVLSAQYVKKSNACSISTVTPNANNGAKVTHPSLHDKAPTNGKLPRERFSEKDIDSKKFMGKLGEKEVLIHSPIQESAEDDQPSASARLLAPARA